MAFWGLVTALSRPLAMGLESWPETAVRIANGGLPLVLYIIYRHKAGTNPVVATEGLKQKQGEQK